MLSMYGIHCIQCGVMYVGETGRSLRSRINGHRASIIKDGQSLPYKHFRLPGHSVADLRLQILEKIYHSSGNPKSSKYSTLSKTSRVTLD